MKLSELQTIYHALTTLPRYDLTPGTLLNITRASTEMENNHIRDLEAKILAIRLKHEAIVKELEQRLLAEVATARDARDKAVAAELEALLGQEVPDVAIPELPEEDFTKAKLPKEIMQVIKPLLPWIKPKPQPEVATPAATT